jgi:NAD(P)-dependent dehydrogenase (short-subunit alcohol dehydrogenase family)
MRDPGGRNAKNASEIGTLAEKDSLPIHVLELDATDDASVERAVDVAVGKAGRIDVAINNAGYYLSGLSDITTEQAQRLMNTNFLGAVRVNRAVLPHMRCRRSGALMHISSAAGASLLLPWVSNAPANLRSKPWPSRTDTNLPRKELNPSSLNRAHMRLLFSATP